LKKVTIRIGEITLEAELNETKTAQQIWDALPFEGNPLTWGDEIYFRIPIGADPEDPKPVVNIGDLAFWPPGNALCIFYGKTPASSEDDIIPASPVNMVGRVTSDIGVLRDIVKLGRARVEKGM